MPLEKQDVAAQFVHRFDEPARWIVRAPGRVNLIGEHTDYNDGFVLPMAIDRAVWIALRPRNDRRVVVHSVDYQQAAEFSLDAVTRENAGWIEYVKGTAWSLQDAGYALTGWEGVLIGDVPLGAGLSSSAALEMATARAFAVAGNLAWEPARMAKLGQRAENQWVGVNCGIMDQLISAVGQADRAVLIDCRSLETQSVPLPAGAVVVVLDTATRRGLVDSAYNERRAQCEAAARFFNVAALRDVDLERFRQACQEADASDSPEGPSGCMEQTETAPVLDPVTQRRARHVISENERTVRAADVMRRGDAVELGRLMNLSHASLRDDYEVSSDALNAIVDAATAHSACYGARMTGAGFGGCAVALVQAAAIDDFVRQTAEAYTTRSGHTPAIYVCRATNGAELVHDAASRPLEK